MSLIQSSENHNTTCLLQPDKNCLNLLVVEDDLCLQTAMTRVLQASLGARTKVDWVASAEEAFRLLQQKPYHLVIADYALSGVFNGLWVWEKCQRKHPKTPCLVISGLPVESIINMTNGFRVSPSFLPKPFLPKELKQAVTHLIKQKP